MLRLTIHTPVQMSARLPKSFVIRWQAMLIKYQLGLTDAKKCGKA